MLPDYVSRNLFKTLHRDQNLEHTFILEDSFSDVDWMVTFSGIIQRNVIKQFHRIGESGIWYMWLRVFSGRCQNDGNRNLVESANLKGNTYCMCCHSFRGLGCGYSIRCNFMHDY